MLGDLFVTAARTLLAGLVCLSLMALPACNRKQQPYQFQPAPVASAVRNPTVINNPVKLTSIETKHTDARGNPLRVQCASCHGTRDKDTIPESTAELKDFHVGLAFDHGDGALRCASCHVANPKGPPLLRLADGKTIPTTETMTLCAQCHGPQYRDYKHGSHGGMNGYWDLTKGGRNRNHCVDCHDPHVPKYQPTRPVLPPKDRSASEVETNHSKESAPHGG